MCSVSVKKCVFCVVCYLRPFQLLMVFCIVLTNKGSSYLEPWNCSHCWTAAHGSVLWPVFVGRVFSRWHSLHWRVDILGFGLKEAQHLLTLRNLRRESNQRLWRERWKRGINDHRSEGHSWTHFFQLPLSHSLKIPCLRVSHGHEASTLIKKVKQSYISRLPAGLVLTDQFQQERGSYDWFTIKI